MTDNPDIKTRLQAWFRRPDDVHALIEQSQDANGYKREPAVRKLGELGDVAAIPHLIVRANDWVPQIRTAAYEALRRLLTPSNAQAFVSNLPAIVQLEDCRRADHRQLVDSIIDFLALPENRNELLLCLDNPDARIACLAMRLAIDRRLMSDADLMDKGLAHERVNVRALAIDLLRKLDAEAFDRVIERALRDPFMPVRREALQQLLKRNTENGLQAARRALFDRTTGVRAIALRSLVLAGEPVEEMLASRLPIRPLHASTISCILWGWAELNARARASEIAEWTRDARPTVRKAALVALAKLTGAEARPFLMKALTDTSPSVCNEAARLFRAHDVYISIDDVTAIALSGVPHVVRACTLVVDSYNKWDRLGFILDVYGTHDSRDVRANISTALRSWNGDFNSSAAQPSTRHLEKLPASLERCAAALDREDLHNLQFTFRTNQISTH